MWNSCSFPDIQEPQINGLILMREHAISATHATNGPIRPSKTLKNTQHARRGEVVVGEIQLQEVLKWEDPLEALQVVLGQVQGPETRRAPKPNRAERRRKPTKAGIWVRRSPRKIRPVTRPEKSLLIQ